MIVNIFSSVVDNSRRVQILLPNSLLSALMTFASCSKFFAKDFAFNSTVLTVFFVAATAFLIGFFVGIMHVCKGIKGYLHYIQSIWVCKSFYR